MSPSTAGVTPPLKPWFRGALHEWAFFASLPIGLALVLAAPDARTRLAVAIYATAVSGLFGTSALYHRPDWSPPARRWLRRLDHSMIFVIIAGAYTPWALLVLEGAYAELILSLVWAGAVAGVVFKLVWIDAPRWLTAAVYSAIGLVTAGSLPELLDRLGPVGTGLILGAGLLSAVGAVVYALGRPDPRPAVFGFHEIFHVLVTAAIGSLSLAVALYALPG